MALPYLAAAYLAQGAFKEPMEALFLLSFALLLPRATTVRGALPLGVIAAGAVYTYSFPGLFWLLGAAAIYVAIALIRGASGADPTNVRSRDVRTVRSPDAERSSGAHPAALSAVAVTVGVLLVLTAPEWAALIDFTHFRAFRGSTISSGLGNLRHQLSPLEALGIWPASDFRLSASAASVPAPAFYLGALVAVAALALGLPRWIRRHGAAVPAALAAAVVIYLGALAFGTVYTSAKALAIAAPLITLISLGGLLARERWSSPARAGARLALALAAGIALSSFLVLHQAPVAPQDHADQLAELRPLVQGHKVLFLGRDNFIVYELRGSRPFTAVRNYYDPNYVTPNLRLKDVFQKFDFDSVTPATLGRFPFVITTRAAYASGPPAAFEPLRETSDFVLWKRVGTGGRAAHARRRGPTRCAARLLGVPRRSPAWPPRHRDGLRGAARDRRRLVAELHGRERLGLLAGADPARRSMGDLDSVRRHPPGARHRSGTRRFVARQPRLPGLRARTTPWARSPCATAARSGSRSASSARHWRAACWARSRWPISARSRPARPGAGGPVPGEAERRIPLSHGCGRYVDWYRPPGGPLNRL